VSDNISESGDNIIHTENADNIVHTEYSTPYRRVLAASTLAKDSVLNRKNEDVGSIREIMIDVPSGRVAYAVLSVGGFLGMGDRLFAIPWESLVLDEDRQCFILDVDKNRFENAPGFDKANWPDMAETSWDHGVREYWTASGDYGVEAGRRYDSATGATPDRQIEEKAREAREAIEGPEGESPRHAEQIGKERGKADAL
jgi:sporulation protein YlmC with PRC-barrel domain